MNRKTVCFIYFERIKILHLMVHYINGGRKVSTPLKTHLEILCESPKRDKWTTWWFWPTLPDRIVTWSQGYWGSTGSRIQTNTRNTSDQVGRLSQVQLFLRSLGNYGKYYCRLLPLTPLLLVDKVWKTKRAAKTRSERETKRKIPAAPNDFLEIL